MASDMTTNTDLHVAMPDLPEAEAWRTRYKSEPGMIGHYPWTYTGRKPMASGSSHYEVENLYTADQVRAAIQQAAVPEGLPQAVLTLNAAWNRKEPKEAIAGHMDLCRRLALAACPAPPKQQPA